MENPDKPCKVFQSGKSYFVWDAEDAFRLRSEHHIVGKLVGAQVGQVKKSGPDNVIKGLVGLPLILTPFEVHVGLLQGFMVVYKETPSSWKFTGKEVEEMKKKQMEQMDDSARRARLLAAEKRKQYAKQPAENEAAPDAPPPEAENPQPSHSMIDNVVVPLNGAIVTVPSQSSFTDAQLSQRFDRVERIEFSDELGKLRALVVLDLWRQGLCVTEGTKFGGDFLVYPGDPVKYHAIYIVQVRLPESSLTGVEVSATSRLGVRVKKTLVLATSLDGLTVDYLRVDWAGTT